MRTDGVQAGAGSSSGPPGGERTGSLRKSLNMRAFPRDMAFLQQLELANSAGFDGIEVNLEYDGPYLLTSSDAELGRLKRSVDENGLAVSAVYSRIQWSYPITSRSRSVRTAGLDIVRRLINAAQCVGTSVVLVLPGAVDNSLFAERPEVVPYSYAYEAALHGLQELAPEAEDAAVALAIENVWNKFLLSPLEFAGFVDRVGSPRVGAYFDTGNSLRSGFPEDWIRTLGPRMVALQVKDYRRAVGTINGFVGLLEGDTNWPAVVSAVRSVGYTGWVTGEVLPAYAHHPERLIFDTGAAMEAVFNADGRRHRRKEPI